MTTDIYQPFVYFLFFGDHSMYIGSRVANNKRATANPDEFLKTYFTSSKLLKKRLESGKLKPTHIIVVPYSIKEDAREAESKLLKYFGVKTNGAFVNQSEGDGKFTFSGHTEETKKAISATMKEVANRPEVQIKKRQTCLDKYGYEIASQSPLVIMKIQQTQIEKYGDFFARTEEGRKIRSESWTFERKQEQSLRSIEWHKNNENPAKRPEVRLAIGLSSKGRECWWKTHPSPLKGTTRPERPKEWCENISKGKQGVSNGPHSDETRKLIGLSNIGKNTGTVTALDLETGITSRIRKEVFDANRHRYVGTNSKKAKDYKQLKLASQEAKQSKD